MSGTEEHPWASIINAYRESHAPVEPVEPAAVTVESAPVAVESAPVAVEPAPVAAPADVPQPVVAAPPAAEQPALFDEPELPWATNEAATIFAAQPVTDTEPPAPVVPAVAAEALPEPLPVPAVVEPTEPAAVPESPAEPVAEVEPEPEPEPEPINAADVPAEATAEAEPPASVPAEPTSEATEPEPEPAIEPEPEAVVEPEPAPIAEAPAAAEATPGTDDDLEVTSVAPVIGSYPIPTFTARPPSDTMSPSEYAAATAAVAAAAPTAPVEVPEQQVPSEPAAETPVAHAAPVAFTPPAVPPVVGSADSRWDFVLPEQPSDVVPETATTPAPVAPVAPVEAEPVAAADTAEDTPVLDRTAVLPAIRADGPLAEAAGLDWRPESPATHATTDNIAWLPAASALPAAVQRLAREDVEEHVEPTKAPKAPRPPKEPKAPREPKAAKPPKVAAVAAPGEPRTPEQERRRKAALLAPIGGIAAVAVLGAVWWHGHVHTPAKPAAPQTTAVLPVSHLTPLKATQNAYASALNRFAKASDAGGAIAAGGAARDTVRLVTPFKGATAADKDLLAAQRAHLESLAALASASPAAYGGAASHARDTLGAVQRASLADKHAAAANSAPPTAHAIELLAAGNVTKMSSELTALLSRANGASLTADLRRIAGQAGGDASITGTLAGLVQGVDQKGSASRLQTAFESMVPMSGLNADTLGSWSTIRPGMSTALSSAPGGASAVSHISTLIANAQAKISAWQQSQNAGTANATAAINAYASRMNGALSQYAGAAGSVPVVPASQGPNQSLVGRFGNAVSAVNNARNAIPGGAPAALANAANDVRIAMNHGYQAASSGQQIAIYLSYGGCTTNCTFGKQAQWGAYSSNLGAMSASAARGRWNAAVSAALSKASAGGGAKPVV